MACCPKKIHQPEYTKRFSIAVSEEAHGNLRKAAEHFDIAQNHILNAMLEHLLDHEMLAPHIEALKEEQAKAKVPMSALVERLKRLSPEKRANLFRTLGGEPPVIAA